jgi:hypothetical protein
LVGALNSGEAEEVTDLLVERVDAGLERRPLATALGRVGPLRARRPFDAGLGRHQDSHGRVVVSVLWRGGIAGDLSPPCSGHGALLP